ncbi:DJ-1/PfpI family protein, partial [Campylobacter upsaliensis]|uniref:DJ-1/PfpI family protein n=1 Tax=Campylobacter upsaliensis TaxID=28080 RepID=UPI001BDA26AB
GYEFDELSQAYLVFRNSGLDVEIASPRGGEVVADDYDVDKPYNAQFLADGMATARLASTRPLEAVKASEFAGIFIVGGKGAMFDLPYDPVLKALLVEHYEAGGVLGAVCHGPVAFTGLTNASGVRLIHNQRVTAFTNEETKLFGEKWAPHFPFVLEDELIAT